jgi:acetyltransferase-like isoleucine patch superfamily enzyme
MICHGLKKAQTMSKLINQLRTFIFTLIAKRKITSHKGIVRVNRKSTFNRKTYLGNNVHFNGIKVAGCGEVHIGDNFHSGNGCLLLTENHNYQGEALPYDSSYICKDILIEDNVWLGERVIILGGITIGEGAIIQAGSVVVKDIPKYAIAGGHPAKVFSYRNIEHYEKLKKEGKFH